MAVTPILEHANRTPITPEQAFDAVSDSHLRIFGVTPGRELIRTVAAWSAFETDRWRAMFDYNMTNMRGTWHGLSCKQSCRAKHRGKGSDVVANNSCHVEV